MGIVYGTHRIILDLSPHRGPPINQGISFDIYSVKYSSFDDAVGTVLSVGSSCFIAKLYIKHAFRSCPVHPSDWPFLGYVWQNNYFVDVRLPFGRRSSPFIFSKFSDSLLWILIFVFGIPIILHCLDDYLLSSASDCQYYMDIMQSAFSELGVQRKLLGHQPKVRI